MDVDNLTIEDHNEIFRSKIATMEAELEWLAHHYSNQLHLAPLDAERVREAYRLLCSSEQHCFRLRNRLMKELMGDADTTKTG